MCRNHYHIYASFISEEKKGSFIANENTGNNHGIKLYGESPSRIELLRKTVEEIPEGGLEPANVRRGTDDVATASHPDYKGKYYLFYTGISCAAF
ncbi:MAG: hypothetical protein ACERKZ_15780 [Lachnotalea sp.]